MTTFTVTTASDTIDANDGVLSLREAIALADAAAGADTIVFDGSLAGSTITLSHAAGYKALTLSSDITIDGDTNGDNKADITINADRGDGGIAEADFHSAIEITGGNVTLDSLTITGGRALSGGGIDIASGATVTIDHSTITGNYVSGQETNSSVSGAGIANAGTLTVSNSAIHDNGAGAGTGGDTTGGGIYNVGTLTITNTTIANNFAEGGLGETFGGNVVTNPGAALGAGIANAGGTASLANVTMTGNVAVSHSAGTGTGLPGGGGGNGVTGAAIGGLYSTGGTAQVADSIILGNVKGTTASEASATGISWNGLNILGVGSDTDASDHVINAVQTNLVFETAVDVNGVLAAGGQLTDNGGPVKTVKLNDDRLNPAIDAASAAGTSSDARGILAHDDPNIANRDTSSRDLGAFELGADTPANASPVVTGDLSATVTEGATYFLSRNDLYATDVDVLDNEQNLTFTVSNQTKGEIKLNGTVATSFTAYDVRTGQVSFTHDGSEAVAAGFDLIVSDGNVHAANPSPPRFNFTVAPVNDKPVLKKQIANVVLPLHQDYSFVIAPNFLDPEGNLTFTAKLSDGKALPAWLKLSTAGAFLLDPPDAASGTFHITVTARDTGGKTVSDTFDIVIPKLPGLTNGADNGADTIKTGAAGDTINAGNGNNTVNSGAGNDKVYTGTGTDKVDLGIGNDVADLGDGNDTGKGGAGIDTLSGGNGDDTLFGGDGSDTLFGQEGNDKLFGDAGNDVLYGGYDEDELHGGTGNDALHGDNGSSKTKDKLFGDAGDDVLFGYGGADELQGGTGKDKLWGMSDNDKLFGDAGDDTLEGGVGNDALNGGTGADSMMGGPGNDTYIVDNVGDSVNEPAESSSGTDLVASSISYVLTGNVENLTLTGTAVINGTGNDLGNEITGNAAGNILAGGSGADTLKGGDGSDTLTGGNGADTFKFAISALAGIDTITDFEVGVDKIVLPAFLAGGTLAAFGAAQSAIDNLIYDAATGDLYFDTDADGAGVAVKFAILGTTTHPAITIADFLFV